MTSAASPKAWAAAGAALRRLHEEPLPPWPGRSLDEIVSRLDRECDWLVSNGVLPTELVTRNREVAQAALRPWRSLVAARWLTEHGFDPSSPGCEFDVLRARMNP